jgi:hypothetical protein
MLVGGGPSVDACWATDARLSSSRHVLSWPPCRLVPAGLCRLLFQLCSGCTSCLWSSRRSQGTLVCGAEAPGASASLPCQPDQPDEQEEHMSSGDDEMTMATTSPQDLLQAPSRSRTSRRRMLQVALGAAGALWTGSLISYVERAPSTHAEGHEGDNPTVRQFGIREAARRRCRSRPSEGFLGWWQ